MEINHERLLERFVSYVKVDTTANAETTEYPSTPGQLVLGRMLLGELSEMGLQDAHQDSNGLVWATLPSNVSDSVPVIAWNSHVDTSPETTGANVNPNVIRDYQGGDIPLSGDETKVITVEENPELKELIGATLITTDGTTLLGGDDKAGIAIIMEAVQSLVENPDIEHGEIRILFTCDEEIGRGINHVDLGKVGAVAAYTLDGGGFGDLDVETFSADQAVITVNGINIHPSIAKDRMVNSMRAAGQLLDKLPSELSPERTDDRDGFIHPYWMEGSVAQTVIKAILRDFDTAKLEEYAQVIRDTASAVEQSSDGISITVEIQRQYRNMADGLPKEPRAVKYAQVAHEQLGYSCNLTKVRGGTDGSMLTEKGLPTPNLSSGQHNPHSPLEWACLDEMTKACKNLVQIARVWRDDPDADV